MKDLSKFTGTQRQILELKSNRGYDENALDELYDQRRQEITASLPKLICCQAATDYPVVEFRAHRFGYDRTLRPAGWYTDVLKDVFTRKIGDRAWWPNRPESKLCNYCGTTLPIMVRDESIVTRSEDPDGDDCDLCDENVGDCWCLPPEAAYKPVLT